MTSDDTHHVAYSVTAGLLFVSKQRADVFIALFMLVFETRAENWRT